MKCDQMWFNKTIQGMNETITESTVSKEFAFKPYLFVRRYILFCLLYFIFEDAH